MSTFTPITGQAVKHNGFTVLNGNPSDTEVANNIGYSELSNEQVVQGALPGYTQTVVGGEYNYYNSVIVAGYTENIGGSANDAIAPPQYHTNVDGFRGYQRIDVSIDQLTGVVTKGANDGVTVLPSGLDGTTGIHADNVLSSTIPAALVYQKGSLNPVQDTY